MVTPDLKEEDSKRIQKPKLIQTFTFGICLWSIGWVIYSLIYEVWYAVVLNFLVLILSLIVARWRYKKMCQLFIFQETLDKMKSIINTPIDSEEGQSIMLTFISPSPKLIQRMEEMNQFFSKEVKK